MSDVLTTIDGWFHPAPAAAPVTATVTDIVTDIATDNVTDPGILGLEAALRAAAPHADPGVWVPALNAAFTKAGITTPRRVSACLGQCVVEAGSGFTSLVENTNYTSSARFRRRTSFEMLCPMAPALPVDRNVS
jgi:hypothetical protein